MPEETYVLVSSSDWREIERRIAVLEAENKEILKRIEALGPFDRLHKDVILLIQAIQYLADTLVKNKL